MCGIFGIVADQSSEFSTKLMDNLIRKMFKLSESRGKEASGFAVRTEDIQIYKQPTSASQLIKSAEYRKLMGNVLLQASQNNRLIKPFALIAHLRLVTNGIQANNHNNQPVMNNGLIGIHNGIVVNVDDLWQKHTDLKRNSDVDSEVLLALINKFYQQKKNLFEAVQDVFSEIEGAASFAAFSNDEDYLLLSTNTGSFYICFDEARHILLFASESYILEEAKKFLQGKLDAKVLQIKPFEGYILGINDFNLQHFKFAKNIEQPAFQASAYIQKLNIKDHSIQAEEARNSLRRCQRCILPETMPFIRFNAKGICNYCENYRPISKHGEKKLFERVEPFRKKNGDPDCILAFSGGRDSSYGLHYITNVLKMKPIAFTYDWGMVTDLARRNQARMCGKLGIEHILISADIKKKRSHIRKNIHAWLKKPSLGTVPIFMAGDKQYISYPGELRKRTNTELVFYCRNQMEKTNFKTGFCGVNEAGKWYYEISARDKLKIISYYLKEYMTNWSYFNSSLLDTLAGVYHSFFVDRTNYVQLFNYLDWDETLINNTLKDEYNWEFATDTSSSWRIGDGTAAFYNYIYYTVAGFSEIDTFRSNQIREGLITRQEALETAKIENQPRYQSLLEYARIIGFDCDDALRVINAMPKLYLK